MGILNKKSKEELDIETQMNIKMLKKRAEEHAAKCASMSDTYAGKAQEAKDIGNQALFEDFSRKSKDLKEQAAKIKSFILIVQDMEMMRNQSSVMNAFAETMKSFIKSMNQGKVNVSWMSGVQSNLDKAIMENEKMGDFFGEMLQDLGQNSAALNTMSGKEKTPVKKSTDKENESGGESNKGTQESETDVDREIQENLKKLNERK